LRMTVTGKPPLPHSMQRATALRTDTLNPHQRAAGGRRHG